MNQFSRDNHYIPQFYLKQWSTDNSPKVWEYRLLVSHEKVPEWQQVSIKDSTGWHRDLYTGIIEDVETDEIENWYESDIERPVQPVIQKVNNREKLKRNEIKTLVRFAAAQHLRTPAAYIRGKRIFESANSRGEIKDNSELTKGASSYLLDKSSMNKYAEFQKWLPLKIETGSLNETKNKVEIKITTGFTRNTWNFQNLTLLNLTHNCLYDHDWKVLEAALGVNLYTSDDPAIFLNYNSFDNYDFFGGWARKGCNILFPISPRFFLFTEIGADLSKDKLDKDPLLTYMMQRFTIENAFNRIYSLSKVDNISECRKREVNTEKFFEDEEAWKQWNKTQLSMEREFKEI